MGMIDKLLAKVKKPKKLLKNIQRWIHSLTMKMFRGRRPDTTGVRGVKWSKLAPSTIKAKKAKVRRGKAITAHRPMVETGKTRDSLKVLGESGSGFEYGTRRKSKKGFAFPGHHNKGKFPFLFISKKEYIQIERMVVDYLKDKMGNFKSYTR